MPHTSGVPDKTNIVQKFNTILFFAIVAVTIRNKKPMVMMTTCRWPACSVEPLRGSLVLLAGNG